MDIQLSNIKVRLPNVQRPLFQFKELKIPFGEQWLIDGESGQGKTTLLHLIAGLFLPSEGNIFVGDLRLNSMTEEERVLFRRKSMGIVFQKLNLLDFLTAEENVELGIFSRASVEPVRSALKAVGLENRAGEISANLSLGEQQRVAIARVLVRKPKILLADEPTSSLDDHNAELVMNGLFRAAEQGTLIVVSHDHRIKQRFDKILHFKKLNQA